MTTVEIPTWLVVVWFALAVLNAVCGLIFMSVSPYPRVVEHSAVRDAIGVLCEAAVAAALAWVLWWRP